MPYLDQDLDAFRFSRGQLPATNDRIIQDSDVCSVVIHFGKIKSQKFF